MGKIGTLMGGEYYGGGGGMQNIYIKVNILKSSRHINVSKCLNGGDLMALYFSTTAIKIIDHNNCKTK